jgi:hypothetical protein
VLPTIELRVKLKGSDPRAGMIQQYLDHAETADEDEFGRRTINRLAVAEVHKIATLDLRLLNCDRHGGNLLLDFAGAAVSPSAVASASATGGPPASPPGSLSPPAPSSPPRLVPIDHELCLPHWRTHLGDVTFCWASWPQAKEPFGEAALAYVRALDMGRDLLLLRDLGIAEASVASYRIGCALLVAGARRGLAPIDLADVALRDPRFDYDDRIGPLARGAGDAGGAVGGDDDERPSTLERLVGLAKKEAVLAKKGGSGGGGNGNTTSTSSDDEDDEDSFGDDCVFSLERLLAAFLDALCSQRGVEPPAAWPADPEDDEGLGGGGSMDGAPGVDDGGPLTGMGWSCPDGGALARQKTFSHSDSSEMLMF